MTATRRAARDGYSLPFGRGFTIVELLVVVSIIVLIIAMMLPALRKVRAQAMLNQCMTRQRQNTIACTAWANDNNGEMPTGIRDNGGEHCIWVGTSLRDVVIEYLGSDEYLNCPNFDQYAGPGYYRAGVGYVIGYNYLAGHPGINSKYATNPTGYFRSPMRSSDPGNLVVWSDLTAWSPDGWTIIAHGPSGAVWDQSYYNTRNGGIHPTALGAAGSNAAYLDGSTSWNPIDTCKQHETGIYSFGAYPCLW